MARVKKSKKKDPSYRTKKKTHVPAERFIRVRATHPGGADETSHYIDIAKELSKVNRRLYRQGMVYRIANISITSRNTVDGLVTFSTAPDTWVTRNAWQRGFQMWNEMNNKVLDMPGASNRKSQWHDYKVHLTDAGRQATKLAAVDNENVEYLEGEWVYSRYESPDGTTTNDNFQVHLLGDHVISGSQYTSVGLIKSYGEARGTVQDNVPSLDPDGDDDPLLNLFDYGSEIDEIAANLDNYGDLPPYGYDINSTNQGERYPGSSANGSNPICRRVVAIGTADIGTTAGTPFTNKGVAAPTVMVPGFDAVCGLIEIETQSLTRDGLFTPEDDVIDILIELAPGNYKGVAAFDVY